MEFCERGVSHLFNMFLRHSSVTLFLFEKITIPPDLKKQHLQYLGKQQMWKASEGTDEKHYPSSTCTQNVSTPALIQRK